MITTLGRRASDDARGPIDPAGGDGRAGGGPIAARCGATRAAGRDA